MTSYISLRLFIILTLIAFEGAQLIHENKGNILCRICGTNVSISSSLFSLPSTKSRYSFNDTLFYKDDVLVQIFSTELFLDYPVITFTQSTCVPVGTWEESTSWFPGYLWKPCVCPECGAFIGFVFEPLNLDMVESSETFYGLILTSLISEDFLLSLTEYFVNISD